MLQRTEANVIIQGYTTAGQGLCTRATALYNDAQGLTELLPLIIETDTKLFIF